MFEGDAEFPTRFRRLDGLGLEVLPVTDASVRIAEYDDRWQRMVDQVVEVFLLSVVQVAVFVLLREVRVATLDLNRKAATRDGPVGRDHVDVAVDAKIVFAMVSSE